MNNLTKISNQIAHQFPELYQENYPVFIDFVQSYYEWLEQPGNIGDLTRNFYTNLDIDTTLDSFLTHFENTYLYGIPDTVKGDKRFLIKHILDVYRAKGTAQGYKLLFRLLYDEDISIYLPKDDIFAPSESIWKETKFLEVTENPMNKTFVGNVIKGSASKTQAVVEDFIVQKVNNKIVNMLYVSNITGDGFSVGEKILNYQDFQQISAISAPKVIGSFSQLGVLDGGQNFAVGDTLIGTGGSGREAELRVIETKTGTGIINFNIAYGGNLYSMDSKIIISRYRAPSGYTSGTGAKFSLAAINNIQSLTYDTGLIIETIGNVIGAYANLVIANTLTYETKNYGSVASLTGITSGTGYTSDVTTDLKDFFYYPIPSGRILYSDQTNVVTGITTFFNTYFKANSYIALTVVHDGVSTTDYRRVVKVLSDTSMILDDNPQSHADGRIETITILNGGHGYSNGQHVIISGSSTVSANITIITDSIGKITDFIYYNNGSGFAVAPALTVSSGSGAVLSAVVDYASFSLAVPIFDAIYAPYERYDPTSNNYWGNNASITGLDHYSQGIVSKVQVKNSGIGYAEGETITFYKAGALGNFQIVSGGRGYANNENLVFAGGSPTTGAIGSVITNANGTIVSLNMVYSGSGYYTIPQINVITKHGSGAQFTCDINAVDQTYAVTGTVTNGGLGQEKGKWLTEKSFASASKFIQDSYYYQDFSYEIQAPMSLNKYEGVVKNVYHPAGLEMFGKMVYKDKTDSQSALEMEAVNSTIALYKQNFVPNFDSFFVKLWEVDNLNTIDAGQIEYIPLSSLYIEYKEDFLPNFDLEFIKLWEVDDADPSDPRIAL